ncbi:MAG: hypothetical protein DMD86_00335 [Candidatus Rokuibacteriota bacterium]|nr:MAG: hypothetical protein DMD86_00335 [Candidatus Rokubacteria bacterium]
MRDGARARGGGGEAFSGWRRATLLLGGVPAAVHRGAAAVSCLNTGPCPESRLRSLATRAAATASIPVRVVDGLGESLPMDDASFDAGVASALLCTVADPARVLSELFRVIRPGGELRFYEHVRASSLGLALIQRIVDATV